MQVSQISFGKLTILRPNESLETRSRELIIVAAAGGLKYIYDLVSFEKKIVYECINFIHTVHDNILGDKQIINNRTIYFIFRPDCYCTFAPVWKQTSAFHIVKKTEKKRDSYQPRTARLRVRIYDGFHPHLVRTNAR